MTTNFEIVNLAVSKNLSEILSGELEAGNDKYNQAGEIITQLMNHFNAQDGLDRIVLFHIEMDRALEMDIKNNPNPVTCRTGCDHCCYMNVDVFDQEAELLAELIKSRKIKINQKEFKKQKHMTRQDYDKRPRACIFLKNNKCQIYKYRPASCRKYYVTSPKTDCIRENNRNKRVQVLALPYGEITYSAMLNISPLSNNCSMVYMISKYL